jgi:SynChlorMet cassette protein ScmC
MDVMQLAPARRAGGATLVLSTDGLTSTANGVAPWLPVPGKEAGVTIFVLRAGLTDELSAVQLNKVSLVFCQDAQTRGGVLVHGALAERNGAGIILAGPGGVGKTTASRRLPPPWRSLCDDATLIVRDAREGYWAHPWPSWSRLLPGREGGVWPVQQAVPLRAIFFLAQAPADHVTVLPQAQAAGQLLETAEQLSWPMADGMSATAARGIRVQRFNNVCALAQVIPCYTLHVTLAGAFWLAMEDALVLGR